MTMSIDAIPNFAEPASHPTVRQLAQEVLEHGTYRPATLHAFVMASGELREADLSLAMAAFAAANVLQRRQAQQLVERAA